VSTICFNPNGGYYPHALILEDDENKDLFPHFSIRIQGAEIEIPVNAATGTQLHAIADAVQAAWDKAHPAAPTPEPENWPCYELRTILKEAM